RPQPSSRPMRASKPAMTPRRPPGWIGPESSVIADIAPPQPSGSHAVSQCPDGVEQPARRLLGVTEEHMSPLIEEELVVHTGESRTHGAFDEDDSPRLVRVQDRHTIDRRPRGGPCRGV